MSDRFILEKRGHVMWLKFNRPERPNAMTIERWGELDAHLAAIDADREGSLEGAPHFETEALVQTAMTRDTLEGARAFFEKREPRFTGE